MLQTGSGHIDNDPSGQIPHRLLAREQLRKLPATARTTYGFRNLDNQRRRVRFACTPQHRRVTGC